MTSKRAVLVVEDEVKLARTIELYLGRRGFTVRTAHNGQEALERITEARPDVIVADIMMPVMDGYALCRRLRTAPATCMIPFLFLTAKDDDRDRVRGLKMGLMIIWQSPAILKCSMPAWMRSLLASKRSVAFHLTRSGSPAGSPRRIFWTSSRCWNCTRKPAPSSSSATATQAWYISRPAKLSRRTWEQRKGGSRLPRC